MIDLSTLPKLSKLSTDELLSVLSDVADELSDVKERTEQLYAVRTALYVEARRRTPPITQRRLAEVSKMSDVAVIAALRKAKAS